MAQVRPRLVLLTPVTVVVLLQVLPRPTMQSFPSLRYTVGGPSFRVLASRAVPLLGTPVVRVPVWGRLEPWRCRVRPWVLPWPPVHPPPVTVWWPSSPVLLATPPSKAPVRDAPELEVVWERVPRLLRGRRPVSRPALSVSCPLLLGPTLRPQSLAYGPSLVTVLLLWVPEDA